MMIAMSCRYHKSAPTCSMSFEAAFLERHGVSEFGPPTFTELTMWS